MQDAIARGSMAGIDLDLLVTSQNKRGYAYHDRLWAAGQFDAG
jgi:hypothetical protein